MGLIARAAKTGTSATTYLGAKTAGAVPLQVSDLDIDFATLYTEINGQLDNTNVATSAGIDYSKLDLVGSIVNTDVHTSANIAGSKLLINSVGGDRIKDQPNGVTIGKINIGSAIFVHEGDLDDTEVELTTTTETWLSELTPTIRGTTGFYIAAIHGFASSGNADTKAAAITARLRTGGTAGSAADGAIARAVEHRWLSSGAQVRCPFTHVIAVFITSMAPGAQLLKLSLQTSFVGVDFNVSRTNVEAWFLEFA